MNTDTYTYKSTCAIERSNGTRTSMPKLYAHSKHISKDTLVQVDDENLEWVEKNKPKLIVTYLKYINLDNICQLSLRVSLTTLPDLSTLIHLQIFDVSPNSLTELPEFIGQRKHLRTLNAHTNFLRRLPTSIGNLTHLQELIINSNRVIT